MTRNNVHIYPSVFQYESRMLKETQSILEANLCDKVIILANYAKGLPEIESIDGDRTVVRLRLFFSRFPKNLVTESLGFTELMIRSLWALRRVRVTHVNAHSLSVLPTAVLFRLFKRARVIYDAHELETERWGLAGARKRVSKLMERTLMPFVSTVVVVGPSIANWYRRQYPGKPVFVVRNIPHLASQRSQDPTILRERLDVSANTVLMIYQGLFAEGRGIELMLAALSNTSNLNVHCVFMGNGPLEPTIAQHAERATNVHLIPPVPPDQVLAYTCGADVGLCMIENYCQSYHLSLPNKFFEYIAAGLPLVVCPRPDQEEIIAACGNGWVVEESDSALTGFLDQLTQDELRLKKKAAERSRARFDWSTDAKKYAKIFQ